MHQIVGHKPDLCLIVIYIRYWRAMGSLQWDVESTSKLDYEGANTLMSLNCCCFELKYRNDTIYEGWISSWFTLLHKGILVII